MSLLDLYDPLFGLEYLLPPPYNTAGEVAECIQSAIDKAKANNEHIQATDSVRP